MKIRIAIISGVVILGLALAAGWFFIMQRDIDRLLRAEERVNILVLGLDYVEGISRTDTVIVMSLSSQGEVSLLSVPRDLRVRFPDGTFTKLNIAYRRGGGELARQVVSDLLGIPIQFYLAIDFAGFARIIDLFGGVTLVVERPMYYVDRAANPPIHINIAAGKQTLDGATALDFVRYREPIHADVGRMKRQQQLLAALWKMDLHLQDFATIRELLRTARDHLQTNLSLIDMYDLARIVRTAQIGELRMAVVPSTPLRIGGVSYQQIEVVRMAHLVTEIIKRVDILTRGEISVSVLNGSGVRLLATHTGAFLRELGFVVSHVGNADAFDYRNTYIITLTGVERKAQLLKDVLPPGTLIVSPAEFGPRYSAVRQRVPAGTDLLLIVGARFEVPGG
ncbi:LCP family protein [Candidatus Acetothermia bacterium]|nr:LCP family protein [Candidatus Acetothermia bacterium]